MFRSVHNSVARDHAHELAQHHAYEMFHAWHQYVIHVKTCAHHGHLLSQRITTQRQAEAFYLWKIMYHRSIRRR